MGDTPERWAYTAASECPSDELAAVPLPTPSESLEGDGELVREVKMLREDIRSSTARDREHTEQQRRLFNLNNEVRVLGEKVEQLEQRNEKLDEKNKHLQDQMVKQSEQQQARRFPDLAALQTSDQSSFASHVKHYSKQREDFEMELLREAVVRLAQKLPRSSLVRFLETNYAYVTRSQELNHLQYIFGLSHQV